MGMTSRAVGVASRVEGALRAMHRQCEEARRRRERERRRDGIPSYRLPGVDRRLIAAVLGGHRIEGEGGEIRGYFDWLQRFYDAAKQRRREG